MSGGRKGQPRRQSPARGTKKPSVRNGQARSKPSGPRRGTTTTGSDRQGAPAPRSRGAARRRDDSGAGGEQVEGRQAVRELLLAGRRRVHEVLVASDRRDAQVLDDIIELADDLGVAVREAPMRTLDRVARTDTHQGVVATADPLPDVDIDELLADAPDGTPPFLLLLDGITDPGNVGALLRTAECAGVTGVVLPRHRAAHITPTVAKAAAGAAEHLPVALVGGMPAAIARLKAADVWVVGLDMAGSVDIHELPALGGPVALVLGAEGKGLSRLVSERVDVLASIPLRGRLGSLNVAAAGAIACYEVARHRSGGAA